MRRATRKNAIPLRDRTNARTAQSAKSEGSVMASIMSTGMKNVLSRKRVRGIESLRSRAEFRLPRLSTDFCEYC